MAIVINSAWDAQQFYQQREEARRHINSAWDAQQFYEIYGGNGRSGTWGSVNWAQARAAEGNAYTYNPATREWSLTSASSFSTDGFEMPELNSFSSTAFKSDSLDSISQVGVVNPQDDAATSSKTSAEKEYIEIEFNTLTGEVQVVPTSQNIKIKAGNTIELLGVGKFLSGLYFVSEVRRKISSSDGYTMSLSLFKNGFGESLKSGARSGGRPTEVNTSANVVNGAIRIGSKVKIVGANAVYAHAHDGVKVPNWVKQEVHTVDAIEDNGTVRLKEIWSWTYSKFLQLA